MKIVILSMKYFCSTHFRELLAHSIASDPQIAAAAEALESQLKTSLKAIPDVLILARLAEDAGFITPVPMIPPMTRLANCAGGLAELSDELLDLLAWQLHVEGYDLAQNRQAKVEIIQSSLYLHRKKGTVWSLRRALEILMQRDVQIPEWFDYGGDPYYFRVRFDVGQLGFYPEQWQPLLSTIYDWKNARSWLEGIWTYAKSPMERVIAPGLRTYTESKSRLWFTPPVIPATPVARTPGSRTYTDTRLCLHFPTPPIPKTHKISAMGTTSLTSTRVALRRAA